MVAPGGHTGLGWAGLDRAPAELGHVAEWGRRFTAALEDIASNSFRRRELGRVVLVQLSASDLATPEETRLAEAVLDTGERLDEEGDDVTVRRPGLRVDDVVYVEDSEDQEGPAHEQGLRQGLARPDPVCPGAHPPVRGEGKVDPVIVRIGHAERRPRGEADAT